MKLSSRGHQNRADSFGAAEWAAWAFILVASGRVTELVPGFSNVPLAKVIALAWLIAVMSRRKSAAISPRLSNPMGNAASAFFVLAVFSLGFSIVPGLTARFLIGPGLEVAVAFALMCYTGRDVTFAVGTLRCLVYTAVMLATYALAFSSGRIEAGTSYDTNDLAYFLVTALPVAIGFAVLAKGRIRLLYTVASGLLVFATLLTESRGGALALIGVLLLLTFTDLKPVQEGDRSRPTFATRVGRLLIIIVVGTLIWHQLPSAARDRLSTIANLESDYNADTSIKAARSSIWKRGLTASLERPIGYGIETYQAVDLRFGGQWRAPHNGVLQVTVELGFLGLFLFLNMYRLAWRQLTAKARAATLFPARDIEGAVLARALRVSLVSNFIAGFFLSQAYSNLQWTFFATVLVFTRFGPHEPLAANSTSVTSTGKPTRQYSVAPRANPGER